MQQAAYIKGHGDISDVIIGDYPDPKIEAPDDVIVEVHACGLNHVDLFCIRGMPGEKLHFPLVLGVDSAGVVVDGGSAVPREWIGRRVMVDPWLRPQSRNGEAVTSVGVILGHHADGGLEQRMKVPLGQLVPIPDSISFETAAALPVCYGTARRMLADRAKVQPGELVLILGASGGVGTASVEIAKRLGAEVIACASSDEKLEKLREMGADHLVNYSTSDFSSEGWRISGRRGVDVCVNFTAGDTWVPGLRCLKPETGRMVTCGATAGFDPKTDVRYIWLRQLTIIGSTRWAPGDLHEIVKDAAAGHYKPVIHKSYPLSQAREALAEMKERRLVGKVLVKPQE